MQCETILSAFPLLHYLISYLLYRGAPLGLSQLVVITPSVSSNGRKDIMLGQISFNHGNVDNKQKPISNTEDIKSMIHK